MLRLNKLEVRNVRGIAKTGPDLNLAGKSLILLGDNATGKSSYIDALEFLLTRQCSSIDISRAGVSWDSGGVHILANADALSIKGEIGDKDSTFAIDHKTDLAASPSPLKEWLRAAQQRCFLLRRRTLLRLIEAQPKERYEALAPFFALDRFTAFEKELKAINDDVESRVELASREATIQEDALRKAFNIAAGVRPEEAAVFGAANQRLATAGKSAVVGLDAAQKLQLEIAEQMKTFSGIDQAVKLETVIQALRGIPTAQPTIQALEAFIGVRTNFDKLQKTLTKGFSIEVLERGKTWILDGGLNDCPLCEKPLGDKNSILARITARVHECSAFSEASRASEAQRKLYSDSLMDLGKACGSAQKTWTEKRGQDPAPLVAALNELRRIAKAITSGEHSAAQLEEQLRALKALSLDAVIQGLTDSVQQELKNLGGIDQYKHLSAANQALSALLVNWTALYKSRQTLVAEQARQTGIKKIVAHAVQSRKDTAQTIIQDIAAEANRLYSELHPGEKIGNVSLKVPTRGEGSINMESQFFDKRGDARLFFSESHLDTLGVALFLALRKKQAADDPNFKLLVLDDVFHSVDSSHRLKAARLIIKEFSDHQFIITTHDPIWFSLLQEAVVASGLKDNVQFHRISDWSLEGGPVWGDHEAEYAFLSSDSINTAQPADIAAKAGRLLEEMLKPLCDQLKISVQFRHNRRFDLGALWPGFKKESQKHLGFAAKYKALVEEIDLTDWVRNECGAHSNASAAPPTQDEAKKFAKGVVELYKATRDVAADGCGKFIQEVSAPKGSWVCSCGALNYPGKAPAAPKAPPATPAP